MTDVSALLQEKNGLILKMLEMQHKFIALEHQQGVTLKEYYTSDTGLLQNYRHEYAVMANRVVNLAHEIKGSKRD
jgi:hypothetical protein